MVRRPIQQLRELIRGRHLDEAMLAEVIQAAPREPLLVRHRHGTVIVAAAELDHLQSCICSHPGGRVTSVQLLKGTLK